VRAAADIVAIIGEHTALKRVGRRWSGLCPFHAEKTASFSVNAEEGFYYCFGCQAKGDVITFVREIEHLDFVDAVRWLADRSGITIHEDAESGRDSQRRKVFLDVMEQATEWYHQRLLNGPDAGQARDYLRSRGYGGSVVRRFRMGWAPDGWDTLCQALGLSEDLAVGSGLGFVNRRGKLQDSFRARVLFPICDPSGHPVALGGRILPGSEDPAKYKNSQETPIYAKRKVLYALNWAKPEVIKANEVVVCEGYTDVIGFFEAGVERAVATCGTALAEDHFRLLRNFATRIVLAFDADGAGQAAASRFYEWESQYEVDVAVASLPAGSDPADLARSDPGALRTAVAEAKPFLQFRVERVLAAADLSTPEGRARAADAALHAVAEHPDNFVRDPYLMQIATRCQLDPAPLRERMAQILREGPKEVTGPDARRPRPRDTPASEEPWVREPEDDWEGGADGAAGAGPGGRPVGSRGNGTRPGTGPGPSAGTSRPGLEALRLAIHRPETVAHRLEAELFVDDVQRRAFEALVTSDDLHQAIDNATPDVAELLLLQAVEEPHGDPDDTFSQLVRVASRRALADLARDARASPEAAAQAGTSVVWLRQAVSQLDAEGPSSEAVDRLVEWLVERERSGSGGGT